MKVSFLLGLSLLGVVTGCGTVGQHLHPEGQPGVYSGVKADIELLTQSDDQSIGGLVGICDLPLSAVADTLLLPWDLTHTNLWIKYQPRPVESPP